MDPEAFDIK
ncbi:hypothetical protein EYZ11_010000 [Aspergillus tanneri]|uniref:Uncharacterized protein n=1 Tax=Aspergillus tanneri TaxID=1220188 RepID=A0A4S3J8L0_9EURO|nr:hypothetical protein EYZ11_010000 [Aspergillus tanneri]